MTDHYFAAEPASPEERRSVEFRVGDRDYELVAASGVFSPERLDPGTAVLLRAAPEPESGPALADGVRLLDLGCGYGPIACVLADRAPAARIWAVDVNARALDLARRNLASRGLGERVHVGTPDDVPADAVFDEIWSNPPIRIGKQALHDLLDHWLPRLSPDGVAWLVVGRNLGADSLQRWLIERGWSCQRHASAKGFRVLAVRR